MDFIGGVPIGRLGRPEEVVEFERAASIHGGDYVIDGGTIPHDVEQISSRTLGEKVSVEGGTGSRFARMSLAVWPSMTLLEARRNVGIPVRYMR
jgi:hypothetical protein